MTSCPRTITLTLFPSIFRQNSPFTKDPVAYTLGVPNALSMTIPIELHRQKRQTLDPCFSKRRINLLEDMMYEEVDRLLNKIAEYGERDEFVPIQELYYCYTVISNPQHLFRHFLILSDS